MQTLAPYDEIYTVADSIGGAVWVPPDQPLIPKDAEESFNARVAEVAGPDLDRVVAVNSLMEAHHPQETCAYLRHGFQVVTELTVPDGPPMWPMWREPLST